MEIGLQLGLQKIPRDVRVGMVGTEPARLGQASQGLWNPGGGVEELK